MYSKKQRIAALIGILLLVLLYIVTLVCAIFNFDGTGRLFQACLFCTIAIPLLIWICIWAMGAMQNKHTMASFDMFDGMKDKTNSDSQNATGNSEAANEVTISKRKRK